MRKTRDPLERLTERTVRNGDCLEWTGSRLPYGYGQMYYKGKVWLTHRISYDLAFGDPAGKVVMHMCDNPPCVNPAHLCLGTHMDNQRDKIAKGRAHKIQLKTHCKNGHPYTPENTLIVTNIYRRCKVCNSDSRKRWQVGKVWNPKKGKGGGYDLPASAAGS